MKALHIPVQVAPNGLSVTENYDDIVRGQVLDALVTNRGERLMYPDYGCDVQSLLFHPEDELERSDTGRYLHQRLQALVPRAFIQSVSVENGDRGDGTVHIVVRYKASQLSPDSELSVPVSVPERA